jgi:hypothetical protein
LGSLASGGFTGMETLTAETFIGQILGFVAADCETAEPNAL